MFTITYSGEARPVTVHLLDSDKQEYTAAQLPEPTISSTGRIRYEVLLEPEKELGGFFLSSDSREGSFVIESCGIDTATVGLKKKGGMWRVGSGIRSFSLHSDRDSGLSRFLVDIDTISTAASGIVEVGYTFDGEAATPDFENPVYFTITCRSGSKQKRLRYYVHPGTNSISLHPQSLGFYPEQVHVTEIHNSVEIQSFSFGGPGRDSTDPLPLEAGTVLSYPEGSWRNPDYELFSWSRAPGILIMDTKNYDIQSRYFKRLAFFVEKYGYTGKLLPDHALEGRHGWNAHDYRAVDLAFFFQKAEDNRFRLLEEEVHLKEILIENGIIREEDGVYVPVAGGIISISRSSSDYLREKFLIHECCHGLFFVNDKIQEISFTQWEELDEAEKEFWRYFLRWMHYNIEDTYLVVNEYLAYLLQQPVGEAEAYFRSHPALQFALENAPNGSTMASKTEQRDTYFYELASKMQEELYEQTYISSETILGLMPASQ